MLEHLTSADKEPGECRVKGGAVKDLTSGMPRLISWNLTLRCPLKCTNCYVRAGENEAAGVLSRVRDWG